MSFNEHGHLDWPRYRQRFGFIGLEPVRDPVRVAAYVTKYITKDFNATEHKSGEHLFYASRGLSGLERVGVVLSSGVADYEGEWCGLSWVEPGSNLENLVKAFELSRTTVFPSEIQFLNNCKEVKDKTKKAAAIALSVFLDSKNAHAEAVNSVR